MKKRVQQTLVFSLILIVVLLIPFGIMILAGMTPPKSWQPISGGTITEQTWITFAGAYLGAIIGALGSIIIMFRTLHEGHKDKVESRKYADYLFIRDILDQSVTTVNKSSTQAVISQMFKLPDGDFTIPDLRKLKEDFREEMACYSRLKLAMAQTILCVNSGTTNMVKESFSDLFDFESAVEEFFEKILVTHGIRELLPQWASHRASITDQLYERLVEDVERHQYRFTIMEENLDIYTSKYSFSKFFEAIERPANGVQYYLGEEEASTSFIETYDSIMVFYSNSYSDIRAQIDKAAESLLSELKRDIVVN